jgi:PAS domain S-box-containing protein
MKGLSSRFHLALGLSSLVVSLLLLALNFGGVPDREAATRQGRVALAESLAIGASLLLDDADAVDGPRLRTLLGFVARRNAELQSIALRRADGSLLVSVGEHAGAWQQAAASTAADASATAPGQMTVPILQNRSPWGQAELRFVPLPSEGRWGLLATPALQLIGGVGLGSFALFYLYLRRMLRHLDPSRSVPGRVRTAFDTLAEGLLVLDPGGRIVLANQAFMQVVGGNADALIGKRAASLAWTNQAHARVHRDETPWAAALKDARARHNVLMYLEAGHGTRRTFMVNCSPVPGAAGRPAGVLVSLDDVTELEEKEIQLRLARDEAESANRAKSDFLANMSHEIRTPMNAILGFTELLRRGQQNPSQHGVQETRRYLDIIHGSGKHLLELINDILDLSKVEAGRLEVERVRCAVHTVVLDVVQVMRVKADEKGVRLIVEFPAPLPATLLTDPSRLRQIITNLVGNALKFTSRGSVTVVLTLAPETQPPVLVIEINDTGIGVPADKLEAIFEPFVQAEASTTRHYGGTGLGLAISRRFARALGGDIVARSTPGQGSSFRVTLEAGALDGVAWLAPEALAAAQASVSADESGSAWQFAPAHVLVVDDGAENRELVRLVLESAGLQVSQAEHGAAALERVAAERYALVLMDVQMPVMDGYTATRLMRERGHTMPVLALTANAMKGFEAEIRSAGFTGHLTKPVDIDAMLATLAQHLQGERVERAAVAPIAAVDSAVALPAPLLSPAPPAEPIVSRLARHPRLQHVVRSFALQLPGRLQAMDDALARHDLAELESLAHWLKGAGGTVGYDAFFEPARDFEQHAKAADAPAMRASLAELRGLAARIVIPAASAPVAEVAA